MSVEMQRENDGRGCEPRILEWKGQYTPPPIPNINYALYMMDIMKSYGDELAVADVETGKGRTYKEICDLVPCVAGGLREAGVKPGHHIVIMIPTHMDYPLLLLSILYCGAVAVTVNPILKQEEVEHCLKISEADWAFVHETYAAKLSEARQQLSEETHELSQDHMKGVWVVGGSDSRPQNTPTLEDLATHNPIPPVTKVDGISHVSKWVALMPFSSGTTSLPKGVMITHQNLLIGIKNIQFLETLGRSIGHELGTSQQIYRSNLIALPCMHVFSGHYMVFSTLTWGGTCYFLMKFTPRAYFNAVQKYKVTISALIPYLARILTESPLRHEYDTSSIKLFLTGGAALNPDTANAINKKFGCGVIQTYGITETVCSVTLGTLQSQVQYPESSGYIMPDKAVKVVDIESGEMLGEGRHGEVCIKTPSAMLGYVNNQTATSATIDSEGWVHTGDIGYYDKNNLLYITDRLKEIIKVKGHQVSPTELENLLKKHPDVEDAGVVGVKHPHTDEAPRAFVVARPGATLNPKDLQDFVAEHATEFKQLRGGVFIVDSIPRNSVGKVLRKILLNYNQK